MKHHEVPFTRPFQAWEIDGETVAEVTVHSYDFASLGCSVKSLLYQRNGHRPARTSVECLHLTRLAAEAELAEDIRSTIASLGAAIVEHDAEIQRLHEVLVKGFSSASKEPNT